MLKLNKKAFTLVELLAVIVILSALILIVIPKITSSVNEKTEDVDYLTFNLLTKAVKLYLEDNMFNYPKENGSTYCVSLKTLTDNNYLEAPIKSFKTSIDITNQKTIKVKYDNGYSYSLVDNDSCHQESPRLCRAVNDVATSNKPPYQGYNTGDAYDCEVKEDTWYRFYILSVDEDTVNLISQQNITPDGTYTSEPQQGDEWDTISSQNINGPQNSYVYLNTATSYWENVSTIKEFSYIDEENQSNSSYGYKSIITELDSSTGDYITTIIPNINFSSESATYKNIRARLPYVEEITENTTCSYENNSCPLWMVNYLYTSNNYAVGEGKENSVGENLGYWTLSTDPESNSQVYYIEYDGGITPHDISFPLAGIRPVIVMSKTDLFPTLG